MPCPRGMSLLDLSRIRSALERSTSPNTLRAYDQAWRRWVAWTKARGIRAMPATPELVAAFLTELADQGLSDAGIIPDSYLLEGFIPAWAGGVRCGIGTCVDSFPGGPGLFSCRGRARESEG